MSTLYLRAARVLTGVDNGVIEDAAVQVEDGRIAAVGPAAQLPPTGRSGGPTGGLWGRDAAARLG